MSLTSSKRRSAKQTDEEKESKLEQARKALDQATAVY